MVDVMASAHQQAMAKQLEENAKIIKELQEQLRKKEKTEAMEKKKKEEEEKEEKTEEKNEFKIPKNKLTPDVIEQRKQTVQELVKSTKENKRNKEIAKAGKNELQDFIDRVSK